MHKRISDGQATLMLIVAFVLDLIPALAFVLAFAFILPGLAELGSCVESGVWAATKCTWNGGLLFIGGALATTLALFFVAPALYAILSAAMGVVGLVIYTGWFYLFGVPIWGLQKNRILVNLLSVLVELIPVLSLLPGITFFVWRHIVISRIEDKERFVVRRAAGRLRAAAQAERAEAQNMGAAATDVVTFPQGQARKQVEPRYTGRVPLQDSSVSGVVVPFPKKPRTQSDTLPLAA